MLMTAWLSFKPQPILDGSESLRCRWRQDAFRPRGQITNQNGSFLFVKSCIFGFISTLTSLPLLAYLPMPGAGRECRTLPIDFSQALRDFIDSSQQPSY